MKKEYIQPIAEIKLFSADVIVTSGEPFGFGKDDKRDNDFNITDLT